MTQPTQAPRTPISKLLSDVNDRDTATAAFLRVAEAAERAASGSEDLRALLDRLTVEHGTDPDAA